ERRRPYVAGQQLAEGIDERGQVRRRRGVELRAVTRGDLELNDATGERRGNIDRDVLDDVHAVPRTHEDLHVAAGDDEAAGRHADLSDVAVVRFEAEVDIDVDALALDRRVGVEHQRNEHAQAAYRAHHRARAVIGVEVVDELDRLGALDLHARLDTRGDV